MARFGKEPRTDPMKQHKFSTPGPGAYSEWSKSSSIRNQPAYSLGTAKRGGPVKASAQYLPGPGQYANIYAGCHGGPTKSRSKSISMGGKLEATSFMGQAVGRQAGRRPGPGSYEQNSRAAAAGGYMGEVLATGGIASTSKGAKHVGPGSYEVKGIGSKATSPQRPMSASTFGSASRKTAVPKARRETPGPGQYDARPQSAAPHFGFGSEERPAPGKASKYEQRPAPGAYHAEARHGKKGYTMGGRST